MNLDFSEEQALLRDTVARFVQNNYSLDKRKALAASDLGYSQDHWRSMGELGWLALPFSENDGGLGGTAIETMIVMEQFGKGLVLEPYFASIVLGGAALRHAAATPMRERLLSGVVEGSNILTLAYLEEQSRHSLTYVTTSARSEGSKYILNGTKSFVLSASSATHIIVSARTAGSPDDSHGITLFAVDAKSPGLRIDAYPTVDGQRAAEVTLANVEVSADHIVGEPHQASSILARTQSEAILALCAEAVGAMEVLYKDTVAYTQQRVQFGHPLSDFQVLQHRMVDMFVEYELAKSLLYRATMEAAQNAPEAERTIHALKALIGRTSAFVGEQAVQLHGGMGMTEELHIGHFFKRLLVIDLMFGTGEYHLHQFAA